MVKIFGKFNGNTKNFDSHIELQKYYKTYGKGLVSLSLEVHNNEKHYYLSLISACYYIKEGILPDLE